MDSDGLSLGPMGRAFAVRACNSHAALASTLSDILALYAKTANPDTDAITAARAALKSATE